MPALLQFIVINLTGDTAERVQDKIVWLENIELGQSKYRSCLLLDSPTGNSTVISNKKIKNRYIHIYLYIFLQVHHSKQKYYCFG